MCLSPPPPSETGRPSTFCQPQMSLPSQETSSRPLARWGPPRGTISLACTSSSRSQPWPRSVGSGPLLSSFLSGFGRRGHRPRVLTTPPPTPAQAQRPAAPQLALKDGLPHEEKGEREEAVDESCPKWCAPRASSDESCPKWCAPRASTYQSPLQKKFRSTDTVGKWCIDPLEARL
jgi:hypothetical protein